MTSDTDQLARLGELLDRQDILDALTRFARGMDRFDRDDFLSAFHADAEVAAGPFVGQPEPLYAWAMAMHDHGQSATHHILLNHSCDLVGDTAHTETYYLFAARNRDDSNWLAGGRYIDRFERRDAKWKIAVRSTVIEWSGVLPTVPLPFGDVPGIDLNGLTARDSSDLSYRRPLTNLRAPNTPS
ncbi:MAG: nuclear transport factor 2 family protein [Sphingomicrobium sp.]